MKAFPDFNQLNLDPAMKTQVAALVSALLEEAQYSSLTLQAREAELAAKNAEIDRKDFKIEALTYELGYYKRIRFSTKSETLTALQRDVFEETWNTDLSAIEAEIEQLADKQPGDTVAKPKRPRAGRQPLPDHLPRIEHSHEPDSCTCGQCGGSLTKIRNITEQLDVEPARFFVHRHIRPQYACRRCETVTAQAVPPAIIDSGMAAVGLLACVVTSKYLDHLPLYR